MNTRGLEEEQVLRLRVLFWNFLFVSILYLWDLVIQMINVQYFVDLFFVIAYLFFTYFHIFCQSNNIKRSYYPQPFQIYKSTNIKNIQLQQQQPINKIFIFYQNNIKHNKPKLNLTMHINLPNFQFTKIDQNYNQVQVKFIQGRRGVDYFICVYFRMVVNYNLKIILNKLLFLCRQFAYFVTYFVLLNESVSCFSEMRKSIHINYKHQNNPYFSISVQICAKTLQIYLKITVRKIQIRAALDGTQVEDSNIFCNCQQICNSNFLQVVQIKFYLMLGLLEHQRKSLNSSVRFLHLGLQIIAAYWAVFIDGNGCNEAYVQNVTFFAYAMIAFNLLLIILFNKCCTDKSRAFVFYAPLLVNLGLVAGMLYYTIKGYQESSACASARALYQFFFIEIIIAVVLFIMIMVANVSWADRYSHWPGNLAWPILFLKVGFSSGFRIPAIVIGALFAFISITSFILNCLHYKTGDQLKDHKMFSTHWTISMIIMFAMQVLAIAMLVIYGKDGDYWYQYSRKIFVIFAAVNIIDFFFWFYGYRRMSAWGIHHQTVV